MRIEFHNLPYISPYEYWCDHCETLNMSMVELTYCPVCKTEIKERGKLGELKTREERGLGA